MRKYSVEIKISGIYEETIEATDREDAVAKMHDLISQHEFNDDILRDVKEEIVLVHKKSTCQD